MKIAIVEAIGGHGGMDYYDYGLAMGLAANNCQIWIYTCDKTKLRNFKNVNTIIEFKDLWSNNFVVKGFKYLKYHFSSFHKCKLDKIDIVHLHFFTFRVIDYLILLKAKYDGFKVVVTVHDVNSFDNSSNNYIEKKCYKLIDGVIFHNNFSYETFKKKNILIHNYAIIPHGNYIPFINSISHIENKVFTILFFGQIKKVKGLDILLNAVKKIKSKGYKLNLIIAGKPWKSDLNDYTEMIKDLDINDMVTTNFRYIEDSEVAEFYSKADLIILPYRRIFQSGVLLLSMSYGKPVLCSNLQAFKNLIKNKETGFLFKNEDSDDLADAIICIMDNPKLLNEVSINAYNYIKKYHNWEIIGENTSSFYKELLNK
ncbi:glycosyltransferase family 4 protein [Apibacter sp. HY039]|uniref:glycosyltransferase family 4 protein n=1 Tax=Apibacter sp. HY039 TaxID=2501476 RepID=UPI000FEBCBF6|nr:glycosyltransferase family 4 protein [Apibacter sp. HY039]